MTAIIAAVIVAAVTLAALLFAIQVELNLGRATQALVRRFMGFIVAPMSM